MFSNDEKVIDFRPKYPHTLPQDWQDKDNPTVYEISATLDTLKKMYAEQVIAQKTDMGLSIATQLNFTKLAQKPAGLPQLQAQVLKSPDDHQARFDLAVCAFARHDIEQGMEALFFI